MTGGQSMEGPVGDRADPGERSGDLGADPLGGVRCLWGLIQGRSTGSAGADPGEE